MGQLGFATSQLLRELFGGAVPLWVHAVIWTVAVVCAVWAYIDWRRSR